MLALTEEATAAGARLEKVSEQLGVSTRSLQRWGDGDGGEDQRRGPKTEHANKLSEAEREKVIAIANSAEYRDLSPKQIVPRFADAGQYVASESTVYRLLREQDQMAHRESARGRRRRVARASTWPLTPTRCGCGTSRTCRGRCGEPSSTST